MEKLRTESLAAGSTPANLDVKRLLGVGFLIWVAGTVALRLFGQYILYPENPLGVALLLLISFPAMALLMRKICLDAGVPREHWPLAGILLTIPTMVLDTFSTAFFPAFYPNIPRGAAALYGGWIIWCLLGALVGVSIKRT